MRRRWRRIPASAGGAGGFVGDCHGGAAGTEREDGCGGAGAVGVAFLLERMPRALDQARFPVGDPKPASSSGAPATGLISQGAPHPPAQKAENPCCTAVSTLNSSVSEVSSQRSGGRTEAVSLYDGRNQHNQNELQRNCKSRTAAGLWFFKWLLCLVSARK